MKDTVHDYSWDVALKVDLDVSLDGMYGWIGIVEKAVEGNGTKLIQQRCEASL
jgi:hypothetical protein